MGANPGRRDRWPPYRSVRFVLVRRDRYLLPARGLVIGWRRSRRGWEAKVVFLTDDPGAVHATLGLHVDWIPSGRLVPVHVDPNDVPRRPGVRAPADEDF